MRRKVACADILTVDYDIPFNEFKGSIMERWVRERAHKMGLLVYCRPSPSGNTHCLFCVPQNIPEEEKWVLACMFLDDPGRCLFNLTRLVHTGRMRDVLFSFKRRLPLEPTL